MIRKILRSLSVVCMALFFMLIMVGSVCAADTAPYAEFVNEPKVQPSPLTIKKTVQSDPPGIEIPDEEFHFVLKINDEFYANKTFMVSTYTGEGIGGAVTGATTDENGGFTLLNNQTAIFEDVANGMATGVSYTITEELPEDSPFECTSPPGNGTVSGVIEEGGTSLSFVNTYHQPAPKEYGELTISNLVQPYDGYEAPESPDFTFELTIGGTPYANKAFAVLDENDAELERRNTDGSGRFTLKSKQKAKFTDVETNLDYSVKEVDLEAGWIQLQANTPEGTTETQTSASFVYGYRTFGVKKEMVDHVIPPDPSSAPSFFFSLLNDDDSPAASVGYYLYDEVSKKLINKERLSTDSDGGFELKAGQTAMFFFTDPNENYKVEEKVYGGFWLVSPQDPIDVKMSDKNGMFSGTFVNEVYSDVYFYKGLSKLDDKYDIPDSPEFEFCLYIDGEPSAFQVYTLFEEDGSDTMRQTDRDGHFTLNPKQHVLFEIQGGATYSIKEIDTKTGWKYSESKYTEGVTGKYLPTISHSYIINVPRSVIVTCRMDNLSMPDVEFEYVLLNADGDPMPSVKYYLYDAEVLSYDYRKVYLTDQNGHFTLEPGQKANFLIPEECEFQVKQLPKEGYKQIEPESLEGYKGSVADTMENAPVYEFVNEEHKTNFIKFVKQNDAGAPLEGVKFKLKRGDDTYAVLENDDGVLNIVDWNKEGTEIVSDANGTFIIKGFEQETYALVETEPLNDYYPLEDVKFKIVIQNFHIEPRIGEGSKDYASVSGTMKNEDCVITVINKTKLILHTEIPYTGGSEKLITACSVSLIALIGTFVLYRTARKKKRR